MSLTSRLRRPVTVTFDCWATLMVETSPRSGHEERAQLLADRVGVAPSRAAAALAKAWRQHQIDWHRRSVFDGRDMTLAALASLGVRLDEASAAALADALESQALEREVRALPGAREALERLAERGVRRALICDTGFSPGRVVRQLLDRIGVLEHLEVTVFSNEVGVPKPHLRMFESALGPLGASPESAVHVGDLRRSDIAGGRAAGMSTVRLAQHNDDTDTRPGKKAGVIDCVTAGCDPVCARPEADAVARDHAHLVELLGYGEG